MVKAAEDAAAPAGEGAGRQHEGQHPPGSHCRDMAGVAVRAFLDLLQDCSANGAVTMEQARRIAAAIQAAGGPLSAYYAAQEAKCEAHLALGTAERKRTDFLGRVLTEPFAPLLGDPDTGLLRKQLPQFFAAIRMIVGDETHAALRARCAVIAEEHRTAQGLIDWPSFYADEDTAQVLEQVLVTVARSFRRFEPRKDWFLIVMNSTPQSVSLGSNAFVARKPEENSAREAHEFTEAHMARLFQALLAPVRPDTFGKARRNTFVARWGADPDKVFGPLLGEITALAHRAKG